MIRRLTTSLLLLADVLLAHSPLTQCSALPVLLQDLPLSPVKLNTPLPLPADAPSISLDNTDEWHPWTHNPECEYAADRRVQYCAYTNARHGSRGWSIVTTPQMADALVKTKFLLDTPLNISSPSPENSPYKVVEIAGKGLGLLATRKIKKYEEIMVDYATLVVDIEFGTDVPAVLGYRVLRAAVERLRDPGSVLGLGKSSKLAGDQVEDVLRTNAFYTDVGGAEGERGHMAVYPGVSRINHACKPNAYTRFKHESLQVSVAAAKDIQAGEEITISYLTLGKPSHERKQLLQKWGFTCQCALCTGSASEIAASDARRQQIETLRDYAIRAFQGGKPYQALRFTRQVIGLLASEELFPMYSEQYENMARVFFVLGDMANAEKYARMSLQTLAEQGYIEGGVREELLERMWARFREEEGEGVERFVKQEGY